MLACSRVSITWVEESCHIHKFGDMQHHAEEDVVVKIKWGVLGRALMGEIIISTYNG